MAVTKKVIGLSRDYTISFTDLKFNFQTFYHHYVKQFIADLTKYGIVGLLKRAEEELPDTMAFKANYQPTSLVTNSVDPDNRVDFQYDGAYACYNWELFFHVPMLVATKL